MRWVGDLEEMRVMWIVLVGVRWGRDFGGGGADGEGEGGWRDVEYLRRWWGVEVGRRWKGMR